MLVQVDPLGRVVRLVVEGQPDLGQVEEAYLVEAGVADGGLGEPVTDAAADPAGAGAGDDDVQAGHGEVTPVGAAAGAGVVSRGTNQATIGPMPIA